MNATSERPPRAPVATHLAGPWPGQAAQQPQPQPMLTMWAAKNPRFVRQFSVRRETEAGICEDWGRGGWSATNKPWYFTREQAEAIVDLLQTQRG